MTSADSRMLLLHRNAERIGSITAMNAVPRVHNHSLRDALRPLNADWIMTNSHSHLSERDLTELMNSFRNEGVTIHWPVSWSDTNDGRKAENLSFMVVHRRGIIRVNDRYREIYRH
jgi:hypothetical protein